MDWIEQSPLQHSIGYMGDGFYRSKHNEMVYPPADSDLSKY